MKSLKNKKNISFYPSGFNDGSVLPNSLYKRYW